MTRIFGLLGLVIVLAAGSYLYMREARSVSPAAGDPTVRAAVDMTGVRADLLAFASAEKQEFALEGKYLPLEELRARGSAIPADRRGPWTYSAEVSDTSFRVTASYGGPEVEGAPKTLSIGKAMRIESAR
jgi:hypothetical protein